MLKTLHFTSLGQPLLLRQIPPKPHTLDLWELEKQQFWVESIPTVVCSLSQGKRKT